MERKTPKKEEEKSLQVVVSPLRVGRPSTFCPFLNVSLTPVSTFGLPFAFPEKKKKKKKQKKRKKSSICVRLVHFVAVISE